MTSQITIDPNVCHGKPCIRGTRIMVANILGQLAGGESWDGIKKGYSEINDADIRAAIDYAVSVVQDEEIISLSQGK